MEIIIASGPVIIEDNKVLLNRHGEDKKAQSYWKFPGGLVEPVDFDLNTENALETACRREAKEEMGIDVEIIRALKPMLIKHPDKEDIYIVLFHCLAKRIGEIKAGDDIVEWNWFDTKNLPPNCAPNIKLVIDAAVDIKANF